jgi:hypothetical protein
VIVASFVAQIIAYSAAFGSAGFVLVRAALWVIERVGDQ